MGIHDKKYTNETKNLFSILRVMQRTEEGTMLKVMLYLYSIHPEHATKSHIAKAGRFNPKTVGKHIALAYSRGFLGQSKRRRKFGDAWIDNDSYYVKPTGVNYIHDTLDSLELKTFDQ